MGNIWTAFGQPLGRLWAGLNSNILKIIKKHTFFFHGTVHFFHGRKLHDYMQNQVKVSMEMKFLHDINFDLSEVLFSTTFFLSLVKGQ